MSEYKQVKVGKLKLKGTDSKKKKRKKKREHDSDGEEGGPTAPKQKAFVDEDADNHGGWWCMKAFDQLRPGQYAIQLHNDRYLFAVDNGTLSIGEPSGDGVPIEEEVFTLLRVSETKIALKSGYGKYVSVNARGEVLARSEAVGPQEQLDLVIEKEQVALQGHNGYFLTVSDGKELKASSRTVSSEKEILRLRTNNARVKNKKTNTYEVAEKDASFDNLRQCEVSYAKQFQSFRDKKLHLHEGPQSSLERAQKKGKLHEAMLDRREKMKSDRMCK